MIVFMLMLGPLVISILVKAINSIVLVVSFISVKLTSCPHGKKKKKKKKLFGLGNLEKGQRLA